MQIQRCRKDTLVVYAVANTAKPQRLRPGVGCADSRDALYITGDGETIITLYEQFAQLI